MSLAGRGRSVLLLPILLFAAACQQPASASETVVRAPVAKVRADEGSGKQIAIFAGGCFWGVEGVFSHTKGVISAVSGYHGGSKQSADYKKVSRGLTQHAEAVRVVYDPKVVRYDQIVQIFFSVIADPTQFNRQGPDKGSQYRSALIPMDEGQRKAATAYLKQLEESGLWNAPIVTRIEEHDRFYPAEPYHQDFMKANPRHPYILRWDAPKVAALKELYPKLYKPGFTPR